MRIVSLVPSDTYSLLRLGAGERLVGRTRYCVEPAAEVSGIPEVGGTKDPDLEHVLDLRPDLVVMNREENTKRDFERIRAAGVEVLESLPTTILEGAAQVERLARCLGDLSADARERLDLAREVATRIAASDAGEPVVRVFVPIWMDPLMTMNGETFMSDCLSHAGARNVFSDRERRFPLAADLGLKTEVPSAKTAGRDRRYPRVSLDEVRERAPELILLPDEPYEFGEAEAEMFRGLGISSLAPQNVKLCSGKALMWPGLMSLERHEEIRRLVEASMLKA